jgi:hypothetical protein
VLQNLMFEAICPRAFKSAWFAKAARKAKISDAILCKAIAQVIAGQADDLGGGVYKKRLSNNQYRSIILARAGNFWIYEFLFAKQDKANLEDFELKSFRNLAKVYQAMSVEDVVLEIGDGSLIEICVGQLE